MLVNTLEAHEEYYRRRAALWEIQALTRARAVAGDLELGARYEQHGGGAGQFHGPERRRLHAGLAGQIDRMRERIANERTPPGKDRLAIKTGAGGLMDAEFLAQAFCLGQRLAGAEHDERLAPRRRGGALDGGRRHAVAGGLRPVAAD